MKRFGKKLNKGQSNIFYVEEALTRIEKMERQNPEPNPDDSWQRKINRLEEHQLCLSPKALCDVYRAGLSGTVVSSARQLGPRTIDA